MSVSKRLRYEVLRRDNHQCRYCGRSAPEVPLTIDHVTPVALGGRDEASNLVTACTECNSGKAASSPDAPLVDDVAQDAFRWARAQQTAAAQMLAQREQQNLLRQPFVEKWECWTENATNEPVELPPEWTFSINNFIAAGLPMPVLLDCVDIAMTAKNVRASNKFRYMCGVAWKRVAELQEATREIVGAEQPTHAPSQEQITDVEIQIVMVAIDKIVLALEVDSGAFKFCTEYLWAMLFYGRHAFRAAVAKGEDPASDAIDTAEAAAEAQSDNFLQDLKDHIARVSTAHKGADA